MQFFPFVMTLESNSGVRCDFAVILCELKIKSTNRAETKWRHLRTNGFEKSWTFAEILIEK